jgi:hypothetical protein
MFVGADYDNQGKLGIVTFTDDCKMTANARKTTDNLLKFDAGYKYLNELAKVQILATPNLLREHAHKASSDIWSILFHDCLLEELRKNGWTIFPADSNDFKDYDLSKYHMQIG